MILLFQETSVAKVQSIWEIIAEQSKQLAAIVPNLAGALAVILIGWLVAKLVAKGVKRILQKSKVDKLADKLNDIDLFSKANFKIVPSTLLSKLLYYLIMFIVFIAATDVLGMQSVSDLMTNLLAYMPHLLSAFFVFIVGVLVADFIKNIVFTTCNSLAIPAAGLISNIVFYFLFLNVTMIALTQAKINTDFIQDNLSIILGGVVLAFAIGYGFASRNIVASFLSSFYNKDKVRPGDIIGIGGIKGKVLEMDNTSIILQTKDRKVVVPLSKLDSETFEIFEE
ncbi:MAG: mechanosensitive ion channel [Saprospiraceae bacterium]|nr:mechanosensitive ion channel [Saprospiraceae bacterium]MDZ4703695.1 mechanosensitive ion channel [Saprospiraceae bacterium]